MQSMKRLGGKMLKRSADQADVGAVIAEFKATEDMLDKLIKDLKAWRNEWEDVLRLQYDASEAFATLYKAIEPTRNPEQRHVPAETPHNFLQKCFALQKMYSDMKQELSHEIGMITTKVIRPVEEAKGGCKSLHRTLKHRDNMKLDYERYASRADHARRKDQKSVKEETALVKAESDLAQAQIQYQTADEQVKQAFPPVTDAVFSLLPYVAATQIMLHTTLVGHIYTSLDAYCRHQGLPSPAPSDAEIVQKWEAEYTMFRKELESGLSIVANGKAVHMPMTLPQKSGTVTGMGIRNKVLHRNPGGHLEANPPASVGRSTSPRPSITYEPPPGQQEEAAPPKPPRPVIGRLPSNENNFRAPSPGRASPGIDLATKGRIPSYSSQHSLSAAPYDQHPTALTPNYPNQSKPAWIGGGSQHASSDGGNTPPSRYATPSSPLPSSLSIGGRADYFNNNNGTNAGALGSRRPSNASLASSAASIAAAKKKPPPPVPIKRIGSSQQAQYVTALYDFEGQNAGDLAFREGDRIRVVKKTDSTEDWWDGELAGRTGSFPANYVQL